MKCDVLVDTATIEFPAEFFFRFEFQLTQPAASKLIHDTADEAAIPTKT